MNSKPYKSDGVRLKQQLLKLIEQNDQPSDLQLQFDRTIATLGINQTQILELIEANPWPDVTRMTRPEVENWMSQGAKPLTQMGKTELTPYLYQLLSDKLNNLKLLKRLKSRLDFRVMVGRACPPSTKIENLSTLQLSFVLYLLIELGSDCSDNDLQGELLTCDHYMSKLQELLDIELLPIVIETLDDIELKDYFAEELKPKQSEGMSRERFTKMLKKYRD